MSNKPTAVNIGIGFDISELKKSAAAGRAEINTFISDAKKARTDLEKFQSKMSVAQSLFKAGDINAATLAKMDAYYKSLYNIRTEFQKIGDASKKFASSTAGMLGGLGLTFSAASIVSASARLAMERERMQNMFAALTGSDAVAGGMMRNFVALDRQSPLSFMDIGRGAQTMMGFGMSQELLMPSLKALSEISMGNSERFQSLSLALGQVAASGKLAGQEVLQMVNAGFNPLQEISRKTGTSMAQLKLDMEAGRVSFVQVIDAMLSSVEPGGRFHGMSAKILDTLSGQIDKMKSDFQLLSAEFGESIIPTIRIFVETLANNKDAIRGAASAFTKLIDAIGYITATLSDLKFWGGNPLAPYFTGENMFKFENAMRERNADNDYFARIKEQEAQQEELFRLKPELKAEMLAKEQRQRDELQLTKDIAALQEKVQNEYNQKLVDQRELLVANLGLKRQDITLEQTNSALRTLWMFDEIQAREKLKEQQKDEDRLRKEALKDEMELVRVKQQRAEAIAQTIERADEELQVQRELWSLADAVEQGLDPKLANKAGVEAVKKLIDGPSAQGPRALSSRADVMLAAQQANRQIQQQREAQKKFVEMVKELQEIRKAMQAGPVLAKRR